MSDSLTELFDRDPLHYSDQNIATIVAHMRETYAKFELGVSAEPKAPKKAPKTNDLLKSLGLA